MTFTLHIPMWLLWTVGAVLGVVVAGLALVGILALRELPKMFRGWG